MPQPYFRASSAANIGLDKVSDARQREAVMRYAKVARLQVVAEFTDAAVSGADPVGTFTNWCARTSRPPPPPCRSTAGIFAHPQSAGKLILAELTIPR